MRTLARQGTLSQGPLEIDPQKYQTYWSSKARHQGGAVFLTLVPLVSLLLRTDPGS